MAASMSNIDTQCSEEAEIPEQSREEVHNLLDNAEMTHNQLYATIELFLECFEYIVYDFSAEDCSCCSYRKAATKGLEQAMEIDE
jgi:hypothetical protein